MNTLRAISAHYYPPDSCQEMKGRGHRRRRPREKQAASCRLTWGSGTSLPLRKAELSMSAYPFTRPSWLPPHTHTLSLALNLLYNFKIKFKKNRKEKALKAKYLPRYLSKEEKKSFCLCKKMDAKDG